MSDTPRTDEFDGEYSEWSPAKPKNWPAFARHLERELAAANRRIESLNRGNAAAERILCEAAGVGSGRDVLDWIVAAKDRIKRLEAAGDEMERYIFDQTNTRWIICAIQWREAKEAKP